MISGNVHKYLAFAILLLFCPGSAEAQLNCGAWADCGCQTQCENYNLAWNTYSGCLNGCFGSTEYCNRPLDLLTIAADQLDDCMTACAIRRGFASDVNEVEDSQQLTAELLLAQIFDEVESSAPSAAVYSAGRTCPIATLSIINPDRARSAVERRHQAR